MLFSESELICHIAFPKFQEFLQLQFEFFSFQFLLSLVSSFQIGRAHQFPINGPCISSLCSFQGTEMPNQPRSRHRKAAIDPEGFDVAVEVLLEAYKAIDENM